MSFVCYVLGIVLSSILTCGRCAHGTICGPTNVKRFATVALVCLILGIASAVALVVAPVATFGREEVRDITREDIQDVRMGLGE